MKSSLYIHIPFCHQKCDYCDFFSIGESGRKGKDNDISDSYITALINEAKFYSSFYGIEEWTSIYAGGGTPGILSEIQLKMLFEGIRKTSPLAKDCEITVEVNPENITEKKIKALADCGVNRISMGIQAYDDRALNAVNRKSSREIILRALNLLDEFWNGRLSVDFIAGLPEQTYASFSEQFELLRKFPKIDHVSLYTLTVEENTPLWKKIENDEISFSYDKADRMWCRGRNLLKKLGYIQYEVSNFSRPGFEARHNSGYWKQMNYVGIGCGATGTIYEFEKGSAIRWTDTLSVPAYVKFWNEVEFPEKASVDEELPRKVEMLDKETLEFEFLMMGFRQLCGVCSSDYERSFGAAIEDRIGVRNGTFFEWKKNRLAAVRKSKGGVRYSLNSRGILLLNRFLEELL